MKKLRLYCLLLVTVLLAYPVLSMADGDTSIQIAETEWTWEENSIAFFEGKASLEGMPEGKLLLKMTPVTPGIMHMSMQMKKSRKSIMTPRTPVPKIRTGQMTRSRIPGRTGNERTPISV